MPQTQVTSEILWRAALVFVVIDAVFATMLVRRIKLEIFRSLPLILVIVSGVFWFLVWILMSAYFWEPVYHYVFPEWARWLIPPLYGILFALVAWLFWWLSLRLPGRPALNFLLLGGLWGMITHVWAISRSLLDKPPMLQGVSPLSASVMPIFEFMFYWCIILMISSFLYRLTMKSPGRKNSKGQET